MEDDKLICHRSIITRKKVHNISLRAWLHHNMSKVNCNKKFQIIINNNQTQTNNALIYQVPYVQLKRDQVKWIKVKWPESRYH